MVLRSVGPDRSQGGGLFRNFGGMVRSVIGTQHLNGGGATAGAVVTDHEILAAVGGRRTEAARAQFGLESVRDPGTGTVGAAFVFQTLR